MRCRGKCADPVASPGSRGSIDRRNATTHPNSVSPIEVSHTAPDTLWGYAQADPTLVGILVAAIVAFAITHVVRRVATASRPSRGQPEHAGLRGRE